MLSPILAFYFEALNRTMSFRGLNVVPNSSHQLIFNFNMSQAVSILEEHLTRDNIFPHEVEVAIITLYVVLMFTGVSSNILVSTVILRSSATRTAKNLYVVNLNASDVALCLFCMPFTALTLVRRSWSLGTLLCRLMPFLQGSTVFVSAATVSAIAIDRHDAIVSPNNQKKKQNKNVTIAYIVAIWIFAVVLSVPICIAQRITVVGLPGIVSYEKCIELWPSTYSKGVYTVFFLVTQFFIPITVLAVTHFRIKTHLNVTLFQKDLRNTQMNSERLKRELTRNGRATMVLMNISIFFAVSWLPWNVLNILADFAPLLMSPQHLYIAFAICHLLAMTSATTNPILYGWLNTNIRRELIRFGEKISNSFVLAYTCNHDSTSNNMEHPLTHLPTTNLALSNSRAISGNCPL